MKKLSINNIKVGAIFRDRNINEYKFMVVEILPDEDHFIVDWLSLPPYPDPILASRNVTYHYTLNYCDPVYTIEGFEV